MNYYELMKKKPKDHVALSLNGEQYTYGVLAQMALARGEEIVRQGKNSAQDRSWAGKIVVIKSNRILEQLVSFLGCNSVGYIPLLVPYDCKLLEEEIIALAEKKLDLFSKKREICMAVMTSGTTGIPKIYFRSYESWADFFPVQNKIFGVTEESRMFMQGSLAFTGNLNLYLAQFYAGGMVIAQEEFQPKKWENILEKERANGIYLIPSKLMLLPKVMKKANENMETILSGSQSLGKEDACELRKVFPKSHITLYYGASELNYITYVTQEDMTQDKNLIGKPFPGVEVKVKEEELYINTPWHVEGITMPYTLHDHGKRDKDGRFYFLGRKDDILNIRGRKVSATKVENGFLQIKEVEEVAVISREYKGERFLEAFVVAKEGFLERYEKKWHNELKKSLASYEMPRWVHQVEKLPKNDSGKVLKTRL